MDDVKSALAFRETNPSDTILISNYEFVVKLDSNVMEIRKHGTIHKNGQLMPTEYIYDLISNLIVPPDEVFKNIMRKEIKNGKQNLQAKTRKAPNPVAKG